EFGPHPHAGYNCPQRPFPASNRRDRGFPTAYHGLFHEPGHSSSSSFSSSSSTAQPVWTFSRTRRTTRTRTNQFMIPMRVRKQMEALHEPRRSRREEALFSVRDTREPPHVGSCQQQRRF